MTRLELWPGLLPLGEARWARNSRLVVADGTLEVHRGRRSERHDVRGCLMRPARPARDLDVSCVFVLVGPAGDVRCAIDLAEWVPGGSKKADRRVGRQLGEPFEALRDALAEAAEVRISSAEWTDTLPRLVSAADLPAVRIRQLLLLALAVVAVVGLATGVVAVGVIGGIAAIGLVLLGTSPVRRWHPRSAATRWTDRAGHLRDEISLTADGTVLWVMDSTSARAGALPVGDLPWQVDRLDVDDDAMQLAMGTVLAVDLPRAAWDDRAFETLRVRLAAVDGIRTRDRVLDRRVVTAVATLTRTHRPGLVGSNLALAGLSALAAAAAALLAVPVAALYAVAAVVALSLAGEALAARRTSARKDAP